LEAVHLLGTGRSFRTAQAEQMKKNGSTGLSVAGKLQKYGGETVRLGLVHSAEGRRVSINGLKKRSCQSGLHLPLQVISPDTHYDFQQNPKHRRGVLDWGCSTWNQISPVFGLDISGHSCSATPH